MLVIQEKYPFAELNIFQRYAAGKAGIAVDDHPYGAMGIEFVLIGAEEMVKPFGGQRGDLEGHRGLLSLSS